MAVTFANDTTKRSVTLVVDYPENILLDPQLNGRVDHTGVEDLAADIEKNGQRTPVLIRKNDEGLPVLVFGHRRWRAVKHINDRRRKTGEALIQLECTYEPLTEEQAFAAAIAENRFRKDTTPMDDCHNIGVWQKRFKKTLEQIAEIYFPEAKKSDEKVSALKWVKDRAALVELAPEAAQAVRDGKVKITAAVALTRLSKEAQKTVVAATSNKVKGKERVKVSNVIAAKNNTKAKTAAPAKTAPAPKVTSSVYDAAETLARAVDVWLEDATSKAEKDLVAAHKAYRTLVPLRKAEGEAA